MDVIMVLAALLVGAVLANVGIVVTIMRNGPEGEFYD